MKILLEKVSYKHSLNKNDQINFDYFSKINRDGIYT